jgi:cell division protein FtsA
MTKSDTSEVFVGLDIGAGKICVIVGKPSPDGVDIVGLGTGFTPALKHGVLPGIDDTVNFIKQALQNAPSMSGCKICSVYVGISGKHIKSFDGHGTIAIKNKVITTKEVKRALDAAKASAIPMELEVIHASPQEFIIDGLRGITEQP